MSHVVEIKTLIRSQTAVELACSRLHLPLPTRGTFELYNSTETGLGIELPKWKYPVVANTETGQIRFDNYQGRWGNQEELDQLLKMYAVERAKIEARRKGYSVTEQKLDNGAIKLTVAVGGAA
jgi:hypothetical protein